MSFNYCIGLKTNHNESLSQQQFFKLVESNKEIGQCLCEYLIDVNQFVHPYFDIDIKDNSIDYNLDEAIEKIMIDFNIQDKNEIAISSDHRVNKRSWHLVCCNVKIQRKELRKYIQKYKKELEKLYFDPKPYANGCQK